jgi:K+-sensing histidine kinase KdpD
VVGSLGLEYLTFIVTALVTGELSARANRYRAEAVRRREELEKLSRTADALSDAAGADVVIQRPGGFLHEDWSLEGVAVYESTGRISRFWAAGGAIAGERLREVAISGSRFVDPGSGVSIEPVRAFGRLWGSIGVAHEAKGPLLGIKIAASALLSRHPGGAGQQREKLAVIREEADRINGWIDQAARVGRAEARRVALDKAPHDPRELVSNALRKMGPLLGARPVGLQIAESLPMAVCDASMIESVLHLLLDNALKYSPVGSPIGISAELDPDRDMIVFTVSDAGPGVPEDERVRIFEKQYRGSLQSGVPGTGLGLASARCLVESHGGAIWITDRPGGGAMFHFSLPAAVRTAV